MVVCLSFLVDDCSECGAYTSVFVRYGIPRCLICGTIAVIFFSCWSLFCVICGTWCGTAWCLWHCAALAVNVIRWWFAVAATVTRFPGSNLDALRVVKMWSVKISVTGYHVGIPRIKLWCRPRCQIKWKKEGLNAVYNVWCCSLFLKHDYNYTNYTERS